MNDWPEGWGSKSTLPPELDPRGPGRGLSRPQPTPTGGRPPAAPTTTPPIPTTPPRPASQPPRRRWGRIIGFIALALVGLLVLGFIAGILYVNANLTKVDAITDYDGRPADTPGTTWLLVGSDSREDLPEGTGDFGVVEGRRSDTTLLLHVAENGSFATLVSLPRDSLVTIPATDSSDEQENRLNAAYSLGGPELTVRTVELNTGLRVDHYTEIGFDGVIRMVDAVGGIEVCVEAAVQDPLSGLNLPAGCTELDGTQALAYVRQRYADPRGDLGRVERQREVLSKLTAELLSPWTFLQPWKAWSTVNAILDSIRVDQDTGALDGMSLMWDLWRLPDPGLQEITVPIADPDHRVSGIGSTVLWDEAGAEALFTSLRNDEQPATP